MQEVTERLVYQQTEAYKRGWAQGFYDAVCDDGVFYGSNDAICWVFSRFADAREAIQQWEQGYHDGISARRGGALERIRELLAEASR